jgi:hypothetical protein
MTLQSHALACRAPRRRNPIGLAHFISIAVISGCTFGAADAPDKQTQATQGEILNGTPDTTTNGVVRIAFNGTICTGTLIEPDIVLSQASCFPNGTGSSSNWGTWTAFPPSTGMATIYAGPSGSSPAYTTTAANISVPPLAPDGVGHDDVALIAIRAPTPPIPSSVATRLRVATNAPGLSAIPSDPTYRMTAIGWGEFLHGRSDNRVSGDLLNAFQSCSGEDNMRFGSWQNGAGPFVTGDWGSPVLFPSGVGGDIPGPAGRVVGGVMGNSSCGGSGYLATFSTGSAVKPNIAQWLTAKGTRSFCSQTGSMGVIYGPYRYLMSWWSPARLDNFATTDDGWYGCYNDWSDLVYSGVPYAFIRREGVVADPANAQPSGTVPLRLYWNGSTTDNATTTDDTAPGEGWVLVKTLGYIWTSGLGGRLPLFLWYSSSRQDYLTTTNALDYTSSGYVRMGGTGTGIIGYIQ